MCATPIWYVVAVFVPRERSAAIEAWRGRLSAMADDREAAITTWLDERRGDAKVVSEDPTTVYLLSEHRAEPHLLAQQERRQRQVQRLLSVQGAYGYRAAYVLDAGGNVVMDSTGSPPLEPTCRASVARVLSSGHPEADFHAHESGLPMLAITAPVRAGDRTVGAVLLSVDPARWLYPLLLSERIGTRTGEALLARQVGDQIEFLSPLRHRPARPLSLRLKANTAWLAALAAVRGEERFNEYQDYRGVPVLGAGRRIPGTGWGLMVKVDEDEAFSAFRRSVREAALAWACLLVALAGLGFGAWRTQAVSYRAQLGESEARFALLRDHANDAIFFASRAGVILDANRKAEDTYGRRRDELIGTDGAELRAPEERAAAPGQRDALARGELAVFETVHVRRDGTRFPVEVNTHMMKLGGQEVFLSIVRDVTERKRAEEALRLSQKEIHLLGDLVDNSSQPIGIGFTDGRLGRFNAAFLHLVGYSKEELQSKNWSVDLTPPEWRETENERLKELQRTGEPVRYEKQYIRRDGSRVPIELFVHLAKDENRQVTYYYAFVTDITERKRAEEALGESEDRFKYIFEHSTLGKSLTRPTGEVLVNHAFAEMLGYSLAEMDAKSWQKITHPDDVAETQCMIDSLVSGERESARWEKRYIHKNGSVVWGDVATSLRRDKTGAPMYFMTSVSDITERKRAEETIRRLNAELEERVRQRTAQLAAANEELEAFSFSVSHDLRAPLRAIAGFSRIVADDYGHRLDDEGKRQLDVICENTQKMGQLIDDLLAFSHAGRGELHRARIVMSQLVHVAFSEAAPDPAERGRIDLSVGELPDAWADPALIRQVWVNLLSNAVKFCRPRPRAEIKVSASRQNNTTVYHIRDNGVGFDMTYVGKLFGVFQRLHSSREFEGNGVGLALVQRIIHRHGGEVWAEGVVDGGATFSFALPEEGSHGQV